MQQTVSTTGIQILADASLKAYRSEDFETTIELCDDVLAAAPEHPGALHLKGDSLRRRGAARDAIPLLKRALEIAPEYALARKDLGIALVEQGEFEAGVESCRRAVELCPANPDAYVSLGSALRQHGLLDEAVGVLRRGIRLRPGSVAAHFNLAHCLLALGRWDEGFREYEWRLRLKGFPVLPAPGARPEWKGQDLAGRTLLLRVEQGYGDAIQYIRFASALAERGARIVVQGRRPLQRLLAGARGVDAVGLKDALPAFDFHCPLMSVPLHLGLTPDEIPAETPYLEPPAEATDRWRRRFEGLEGFKVGLVWSTSPVAPRLFRESNIDKGRKCIPLEELAPLSRVARTSLVSLQVSHAPEEAATLEKLGILDVSDGLSDFAETAAAIANLDAVVSIDTAAAHLAGALGKPVCTLLPRVADWRWLQEGPDTSWYPTMQLARQKQAGRWKEPVREAAAFLREKRPAAPRKKSRSRSTSARRSARTGS